MKLITKIALGSVSLFTLTLGGMVVQAGGWDNFKLQYFHLTSVFYDQSKELDDIRKQANKPQDTARIDLDHLFNGGPPKDGIPSIDNPQFDTASTTPFPEDETVIGVVINGEAKAYPYKIMNWHEIVNDTIGGINVSVTYCPLCDTIATFTRGNTTFGVSGKLYQSCLVMYDRADDTLYAQPWTLGIVGPRVNQSLERIPAVKTTLGDWLEQHPKSKILSTDTGYNRNYQQYPYGSYYTDDRLIFSVRNQDQRDLHPKAIVSYIWESSNQTPKGQFGGASQQFSHQEMKEIREKTVPFNGRQVKARWDEELETVIVEEMDGTRIPSSTAFAFVYPAFFGESE
ncbi:MAG: DUF3179 domain-containing protein [Cyanobacteria bacterium]|jgi:hypothetical protein|nr:DUF3179 domain-containing protein [Cyanobacteria bacterium GSL.Bin1]